MSVRTGSNPEPHLGIMDNNVCLKIHKIQGPPYSLVGHCCCECACLAPVQVEHEHIIGYACLAGVAIDKKWNVPVYWKNDKHGICECFLEDVDKKAE